MESGIKAWTSSGSWARTTAVSYSTSTSWTDSPGTNYAVNADSSLSMAINLSGTKMPVLEFWQRYSFQENSDYGFVEVSNNSGSSWTREYFVTGASATWVNELVDLTAYAGNADVRIRFRLTTDGSGVSDGWYIDDVSIHETAAGRLPYPFSEDFSTSTNNWVRGSWGRVSPGHGGGFALTDSPLGNYVDDIYGRVILKNTIDLSGATHPQLSFWHKYTLYPDTNPCHEVEADRARVYVSGFFGQSGTWTEVAAYSGNQASWTQVQIDLSAFAEFSDVRVMFVLDDDDGRCYSTYYRREADGWHIDDILIQEAPADVTLNTPTGVTMHDADLAWSQNADAGFNRYEVYRAKNADPTRSSTLVATITSAASTTLTDIYTVLQPDRYRYRIYVVDNLGRYSLGSNVVEAVYTVPQVSFPFFDSMEGGTSNWEWGAPWGQVTSSSHSTTTSWTDSPLGSYDNNANTSLTTFVSLAGSASPVLTFWQKQQLRQAQDFGYVEVSADGGKTWTKLVTITGTEDWNQESVNLNAYRGAVIGLRFRLLADASEVSDGWYIDDVRIADNAVAAAYPFTDDMESGLVPWLFDSPWGQTNTAYHSTTTSWTDSPSGNYATNADTSLKLTINLSGTQMPVLDFWQRYSLQENSDFGYVEVSINSGTSWTREYFVTGASATWVNELVDLTAYAGNADVRIRFRLISDGSGVSDGWYVDDISINETKGKAVTYPFLETFGSSTDNWITGPWETVGDAHSGSFGLTDSPLGNYGEDIYGRAILANTIDLSGATHPQLSFWHKYAFYADTNPCHEWEQDRARVYVSSFFGKSGTWQEVGAYGGTQSSWTQVQIDLTTFAGFTDVRVMFVLDDDEGRCYTTYYKREGDGWHIDDIRLQEAPTDITLNTPTGVTMHDADLAWSQNADAGFNRYEVYRAKNANPTLSSALVATLTGVASTTLTDIYTVLQPDRYRYRVYVVDNLGRYSLGSNVVEAVYKVPQVAFPFFDSMEGGTGNWEWGAPWGQVTSSSYSGNTSWTDSPLGSYANNANTSLTTFVSLAGSASPVLTFWQKLQLRQAQDYGYVEVSTDGGKTWTKLLTISGTESWNQESVNLNAYRGAVIGLRFRLLADAANVSDGWYIDDVRIANNAVAAAYPFTDDMESGLAPWLFDSPWGQTKTASHSTSTSWTDSPSGNYGTNADTSLKLTINLATAVIPVLEFWHRYSLQENSDYGYIEVSTNGGANWTREYSITGGSATWAKVRLDLTAYGGSSDVRIRFRLVSDGSGVSDGWYIDDVSIAETSHAPLTYPLFNDFEAGGAPPTSDWTPGPWTLVGSGHSGSGALTDSPLGNYEHDMYGRLILANTIDLSKANKPQLSFWHKYAFYPDTNPCHEWEYDRGRVYVSNFYGKSGTWQELAAYGGTQGTWTKVEVDLTAYVGFTNVRVMFVLDDDEGRCYSTYYKREGDGWYIDDVRIDEVDNTAPAAVADLAEVSSTANSASVRWTATGDDNKTGTARSYDIRYLKGTALTTSNWATANLATGEPTPKAAGSIEDFILKGLAANSTYHIGMVVSDEVGNLSALSNVLVISTFATGTVQVKINAPTEVLTSTTTATSTLAVRLDVDQVTNLNATSYEIKFNPAVLDFVNVLPGLINSTAFPVGLFNESPAGTVTVTQDLPGTTTVTGTGQLATIVFTVIGSASSSSAITASDGVLSDGGASPIPSNWTGDSVTLVDTLSGDANGDRVVNALDVTKIKRIIVRLDALTTGSDANGDGKTNALDLTKAKRIIVGLE